MKTSILTLLVVSAALIACKPEEIPDPAGTVSMSINSTADETPIIIYEGAPDIDPGYPWEEIYRVKFGMPTGQTVFKFATWYWSTDGYNYDYKTDNNCWISDIGEVDGLGYVVEKPTSGYAKNVTVTSGHGYVFKIKKSADLSSTQPDYYGRVYVLDYATSATSGGIIGADLKYQFPF